MRRKRGEDPIRQFSIKHRDLLEIVINISSAGATSEAAAAEAVETGAAERKQPDGKQSRTIRSKARRSSRGTTKLLSKVSIHF